MSFPVSNGVSIKERILRQLQANFEAQIAGEPSSDPFDIGYSLVVRAPLTDRERGKNNALSITAPDELKKPMVGFYEVTMKVVLEVSSPVPPDVDPDSWAQIVLQNIERQYYRDPYLNDGTENLSLNIVETGNTNDVDTYHKRRVEITVFLDVLYRYGIDDPRRFIRFTP